MNINQNFLSTSSKNNNNNDSNNKSTPRTAPFIEQINNVNLNNNTNNNSNNSTNNISNNIINNNNTNIVINNSANNNNFNILNKFNNISKIESNNSLIINGIQSYNKKENDPINKVENSNNNINIAQNQNNNISPKQVRKKILCMHEFSKTGYAGEDEKKINQDNYFVFRNFVNNVNYIFMAVCDGHGAVGQEISNFLKENLPIDLNHALKNKKKDILTDDISDIITDIFIQENNKLISNEMINSLLSGSTCVSTIYTPIKLITANVGDSRIILGKYYSNLNKWISIDITRDHKPSLPDEAKRILEKGGRIEPMRDEDNTFIGPPRVWLKEQDYPGLAMSRSFGDRVAHSVGVSEEPEIKEYTFCKEDKFFVVASDGLFEFISSHDIVEIIKDFYLSGDIVGCCEYLYKLSREKWMKEEEVVDDITMILVFLEDE
jgi:serine/threonine protein phosphatase PrpC